MQGKVNKANRIVSSETEELILVDEQDNEAGFMSKALAHDGTGVLHRAFSVFLFNDAGELLLQQRAKNKRLWPGFWSNSCCSHPRRGESMEIATGRRLRDELNIEATLSHIYKFSYQADFGELGAEHELCHVYLGRLGGEVHANESEVEAIRFVSAVRLEQEFIDAREQFTPWFLMEWRELRDEYGAALQQYLQPT